MNALYVQRKFEEGGQSVQVALDRALSPTREQVYYGAYATPKWANEGLVERPDCSYPALSKTI